MHPRSSMWMVSATSMSRCLQPMHLASVLQTKIHEQQVLPATCLPGGSLRHANGVGRMVVCSWWPQHGKTCPPRLYWSC